jgi:hypothetical protein
MPQMIRMSLTDAHNAGYNIQNRKNIGANVASKNLNISQAPSKKIGMFSGAMINRIHNAKPGCSACGRHN